MTTRTSRSLAMLGTGWSFPLLPEPGTRQLAYSAGDEKLRQSILLILETAPGERIMRPGFGAGLRRYLMTPNTAATRALIQRDVDAALREWEPRIQLVSVSVTPADEPSLVFIDIAYLHARDGSPANLVYPFYLE